MLCCLFSHQRSCFWIEKGIIGLKLYIFLLLRCLGPQKVNVRSQACPCSIQWQGQRMRPRRMVRLGKIWSPTEDSQLWGWQPFTRQWSASVNHATWNSGTVRWEESMRLVTWTDRASLTPYTCPCILTGDESYQCWEIQFKNLEKRKCSYSWNNMYTVY